MRKIALLIPCLTALALSSSALGLAGGPPRNLRVTSVTDWTVGLRWDEPNGHAPQSYVIQSSTGATMSVPGTRTTATFSNGFDYNRTYSFRVYAVHKGNSWSNASNQVTATLLTDVTPPTKPIVNANATGPTHVDLAWASNDGCPIMRFDIYLNGALWQGQVAGNTRRIVFLHPSTAYTFTVRARDAGGNWSPMSDPFVVTTPAADASDLTAPTTPPGFWGDLVDTTEAMFWFGDSTDNVTPNELIQYHIYLNGVFDGGTIHPYPNQFFVYLTPGIVNTVELYAVDEAGNRSIAATQVFDLR